MIPPVADGVVTLDGEVRFAYDSLKRTRGRPGVVEVIDCLRWTVVTASPRWPDVAGRARECVPAAQ